VWLVHARAVTKRYRIMSFDHDLFSFTDTKLDAFPLVHITSPKSSSFLSQHEPWHIMRCASHIRFLAFDPARIATLTVSVDDDILFSGDPATAHTPADGGHSQISAAHAPFYAVPWNPTRYNRGLHTLRVVAVSSSGARGESQVVCSACSPCMKLSICC